jgi:26S proteasome regulatory subunit N10
LNDLIQNKIIGGQRVILFVGSPIVEDEKNLVKMGKLLKKNNIAVDIVSLGDIEENIPKLQALVDAANTNSNSHLLGVPTGVLPSDVLINSEILLGSEATSQRGGGSGSTTGGATGAGAFAEYGGIDPSIDPELALALRVSMEEERARQEAAQKKAAEEAATATPAAPTAASAIAPSPSPASPKKVVSTFVVYCSLVFIYIKLTMIIFTIGGCKE